VLPSGKSMNRFSINKIYNLIEIQAMFGPAHGTQGKWETLMICFKLDLISAYPVPESWEIGAVHD
jgi:hypothetical protein